MKIYVDSVGCRLNQSEIEKIANQFRKMGHQIVESDLDADLVVINTCTVTGNALADSRKLVRRAGRNPHSKVIATGCWATIEPEEIMEIPGVIEIVDNFNKERLVEDFLGEPIPDGDLLYKHQPLPGARFRTRAFIKAQDGCNNYCTFCVTRIARGRARSVPLECVLEDILQAQRGGVKEVVLTGVNLASWGFEWTPRRKLSDLVRAILSDTDIERLRLSSVEPWELEDGFFKLWENRRLCRQLHLPLQSGSDAVLKRMGRKNTRREFSQLVSAAMVVQPDIAITTDIIVGFPGETDAQFNESLDFIETVNFSGGHVFSFSPRPGTPAFNLYQNNSLEMIKQRSLRTRALFDRLNLSYREKHLEQLVQVLWEKANRVGMNQWKMTGLSDNYIRIESLHQKNRWNEIDMVRLTGITQNGLIGEIIA